MKEKKEISPIKWLFSQIGHKKSNFVFSVVTAVIGVISGIIPYYIVVRIIGNLLDGNKNIDIYAYLCFLMVIFYILKVVFHNMSTMASHKAAFTILANIRKKCTDKLAKMPLGKVLSYPNGALKSIIVERVDSIEVTLSHIIPEYTSNLLAPAILLVSIFFINWKMGLVTLITMPIGILCFCGMMKGYDVAFKRASDATKNLNDTTIEYINGIEVIKVFGREKSTYDRFVEVVNEGANSYIEWMQSCNIYFSFALSIMPATMVSILPIGTLLVLNGSITALEIITIIIYSIALIEPLIIVMSYEDDIKQMETIVNDVRKILDEKELERPEELAEAIPNSNITLESVNFAYYEKEVIHNISMEISDNEYIALVGPSGSGKSTIAKLIAGMWDVNSGSIKLGGVDIRNIPFDIYQSKIAYVSQDNYLFNDTIMENIRIGKLHGIATDEEVIKVAKESGCHDFITNLENGYDTVVGSSIAHLSGGEIQRISIARAMLKDAPIVILDEATSYIDPENEAIIQEAVSKLVRNKTLIVIAHRLSTITNADTIYCIENGNIVEKGSHSQLLKLNKVYKDLWENHIESKDLKEAEEND